ncbi:MAPEG family protein [Leisingera aquaemixtae]|uniref:MAPEG family protein n=1 Tax=Leisingera aquaemixtae TaxID=1396826 RepID=A0ABY5WFB8_9RHOB|nr:MAPEG family protein [Leisingera aquaemixtae]UWQ23527.1 MAPEG family protein [Leisingera aquaemixtae]UWQ40167.1 MAPEG family protein [Leisingera aquaemixtae]UWQ44416.1 MAPEG family protein [Leisingera aquaemixtae]
MEAFAAYSHALAALVIFTLIILALSPVSALAKQKAGLAPGATPREDYADKAYRLNRAYLNGCETLPAFLTVTLVAILAGAAPFWVNLLASLVLVSRLVMIVIHLRGAGKPHGGLRSVFYVIGWACMGGLALLTLAAVF